VVIRPEQHPEGRRLWIKWTDTIRTEPVAKAMREMAYAAAYFDSTPDAVALAALSRDIEKVEAELTRFLAVIDGMYVQIKEFQAAVDKLVAADVTERDEFAVFGPEAFDRMAALYKTDRRQPWRSQNGIES
jgi:hypothetical protein